MHESIDNETPLTAEEERFHTIWATFDQIEDPAEAKSYLNREIDKAVKIEDYQLAAAIKCLRDRNIRDESDEW